MDDTLNKNSLYNNEIPYRIVKKMAENCWPHQYITELHKYALMLIKPEALLLGKALPIFSILQSYEYKLVYFLCKKICPTCISELWKFSWVNSSLERIIVNQKLFSTYESLILILRVRTSEKKSACELLTDLKGSTNEWERKPYQIRAKIKPINYILNYVHTSDDQYDFLRELGILLDWEELIQAFDAMISNCIIPYPKIDKLYLDKMDLTLDRWLKDIYLNIDNSFVSISDKKYIIDNILLLKSDHKQKITLDFLYALHRNRLIRWNFETIAVISNHIDYMR